MDNRTLHALLDSLIEPIVFADTDHIVRYLNKAAILHFKEGRTLLEKSILDCHNDQSNKEIIAILAKMKQGLDEQLITDNDKQRIFMRAVRDSSGQLLGYYERYENKNIL